MGAGGVRLNEQKFVYGHSDLLHQQMLGRSIINNQMKFSFSFFFQTQGFAGEPEPYRLSEAIILTCKNVEIMGRFTYLPVYMLMFIEKHSVGKDMIYTIDIPKLGTN